MIIGTAFGARSPVTSHMETLYVAAELDAGTRLALPRESAELAVYVVSGGVSIGSCELPASTLGVLKAGHTATLEARTASRVMLIGGASPGERHVWWNFVSSSRERIEQAKADWLEGRFDPVPGDDEFIPLPER